MTAPKLYRLIWTEEFDDLDAARARRAELFVAGQRTVRLVRRDSFSGTYWPVDDDVA